MCHQTDKQITIYCAFNTKSVNWDFIKTFSVNFWLQTNQIKGFVDLNGTEQYGNPGLKSLTGAH